MAKTKEEILARQRKYYHDHKEERIAYYKKNRIKEILKKRRKRNKNINAPIPEYGKKIKKTKEERKKELKQIKLKILSHYGNKCFCCKEDKIKLLTVDHIENNGREHGNSKRRYKGAILYLHLIKLNYPKGIQILCFNCNIGRRNNNNICPHKD